MPQKCFLQSRLLGGIAVFRLGAGNIHNESVISTSGKQSSYNKWVILKGHRSQHKGLSLAKDENI